MNKSFERVLYFTDFQYYIIIFLVFVSYVTVISNVVIIIVMIKARSSNAMSASRRPNILMTNIAISAILILGNFFIPITLIVPGLNLINPTISVYFQSLVNYVNALSLYVISLTMMFLSYDQYFSLTNVFHNPLDKISTKLLIKIIWISSALLSTFFLVTNDVHQLDLKHRSLICTHYEDYMHGLSTNKSFKASSTIIRLTLQYFIPAVTIFVLSIKTIFHFALNYFQKKENRLEFPVILRLILIFLIFISTNTSFHLTSIKQLIFNFTRKGQNPCDISSTWINYYLFLLSSLFHPIIYFWFSKHFRQLFYTHFNKNRITESNPQNRRRTVSSVINVISRTPITVNQ